MTVAPLPLWPHQEQAAGAACGELAGGGRAQVVMACGTGKTRVGAEVSRQLAPGGKVLVVVPTLELLAQTARVYADVLGTGTGLVGAVCSGSSPLTIERAELQQEMAHLQAGVSTDAGEVAAWLKQPGRVTVFATYQSLDAAGEAARAAGTRWDLLVVDEAHRSAGRADRAWHGVHDDAVLPAGRRLYMTATPRLMTSDRFDVTSMDDEAVFGREAYRLPFAAAISRGLLADYRVAVTVITDAEIARLAEESRVLSAGGLPVTGPMLAGQVALLKACRQWGLRRVITYHHRVAAARRFAGTLLNAADLLPEDERPALIRAEAVDGTMPLWQRREVLRHLASPGDHTVTVSNARVLAEGVDVPELDAVMFADPRDSATDVVQAVGRALRKGTREGKTATIIVPVILAAGETAEAALEGSAYDMVWRVIRALRAHDERLADELDASRIARTGGDGAFPRSVTGKLLPWMTLSGTPVTASFAAALQVRMLEQATPRWLNGYGRAAAYRAEHGHLAVHAQYKCADGYDLGGWITNQRTRRKQGLLAAGQVAKLDALGMIWDVRDAQWAEGITRARAYRAEHGNLLVPAAYMSPDGHRLGQWIHAVRTRRNRGEITGTRAADLDALGMPRSEWDAAFERLAAYRQVHGTGNVPQSYTEPDGFRLGQWLSGQRHLHSTGRMRPERKTALETEGVTWDLTAERHWNGGIGLARKFQAAHGTLDVLSVPKADRGNPAEAERLLGWLRGRRKDYLAGTLTPERAAEAEALGIPSCPSAMPPPPRSAASTSAHEALRAFAREHGHIRVPYNYTAPDGTRLGYWMRNKKAVVRRGGRIPAETETLLRELGADWLPGTDTTGTGTTGTPTAGSGNNNPPPAPAP